MLNIIITLWLVVAATTGPFAHHTGPVACAYQGSGYIACVTDDGYWFGELAQAEDPSEEGYIAWWTGRNLEAGTERWLVGDFAREAAEGTLWVGQPIEMWLVDLPARGTNP